MPEIRITRGNVVRVDLGRTVGSETRGIARPCIIVQNNTGNESSPVTIIVPVTDASGREPYPFQVLINAGEGGLSKDSIALGEQIRVIDKSRILRKLGTLRESTVRQLDNALRNSLQL